MHVHDDGISPSFFDNQQQQPDWDHTYDPLYRLVTATGRESAIDDQDPVPSWVTSGSGFGPTPPPSGTAARNYVQQIAYDPVGNLSSVQHFVPGQSSASWTRSYSYPAGSNRLSSDTVGGATSGHGYDSAGNMSSMPHLPGTGGTAGLQWNWANQLEQTYSSSSAAARYAYGGDGQRVVKRFGSLSGSVLTPSKVTVYLPGGFEITGSFSGGALQVEWQSLAVMDDRTCVARFEVKAVDGGAATGESAVLRYQVGNHLGSACLETSEAGQVLTREEYYAYGGTAYAFAASGAAGFSVKRYRYAGKECDSENGLYYFGARYFAAWLGRWTAGDPVFAAGRSAYEYCSGNPVSRVDPDGAKDAGITTLRDEDGFEIRLRPETVRGDDSGPPAGVRASNWVRSALAFADRVSNAASEPGAKAAGRGMTSIGNAPGDTPAFRVQQHQAERNFQARLRSGETAANITGSGLGALASIVARLRGGDALDVANWSQLGANIGQAATGGLALAAGILSRRSDGALEAGAEPSMTSRGADDLTGLTFGRDANQVHNAFRHTDKLGLSRDSVMKGVREDLKAVAGQIPKGKPLNQVIEVGEKKIQYSAFRLADGTINVGRIHGVP